MSSEACVVSPREYVGLDRGRRDEIELVRMLRKRSEAERWEYVRECLDLDWSVGLGLARRVLSDRGVLCEVLRLGLDRGDASTVRWWIEAVLPGLGVRRVARELALVYSQKPQQVSNALYWLANLVPNWRERDDVRGMIERAQDDGFLKRGRGV